MAFEFKFEESPGGIKVVSNQLISPTSGDYIADQAQALREVVFPIN